MFECCCFILASSRQVLIFCINPVAGVVTILNAAIVWSMVFCHTDEYTEKAIVNLTLVLIYY